MAEIKNNFLKSKMNKDLDDRLIPNGEYRDAQNVSVGKSEDADVGALENILGNNNVTLETPYSNDCEIIGYISDTSNNYIITFVTNYKDADVSNPTFVYDANKTDPAPNPLYECHICLYNTIDSTYRVIVTGDFLNFSTTNRVIGVNLIEELLFFTDNRNQPRKINVSRALRSSSYYNSEVNISVAKYNPYLPIDLIRKQNSKVTATTSGITIPIVQPVAGTIPINSRVIVNTAAGLPVVSGTDYVYVVDNSTVNEVTVSSVISVGQSDLIYFFETTMSNESNDNSWPGDPDLLKDKYVRLSYRFKFDDGENSIIAPFTQVAYIPKQQGYFVQGDEEGAYRSTVLEFMENNVDNIDLMIPLPSAGKDLENMYKVSSIDILYKESDALAIKVLETVPISAVLVDENGQERVTNVYKYIYQSRKPYKTLPQSDTTRVYDKVPVRALAQETSGNRIIYGNFYDQYTPPAFIDYNVGVFQKNSNNFSAFAEYPNHTVKQNRNYQVGFILSDKFGRQSPVVLSPVTLTGVSTGTNFTGGSTIYHPYTPASSPSTSPTWLGDAFQVVVNSPIQSAKDLGLGRPGLYAIQQLASNLDGDGFAVSDVVFSASNSFNFILEEIAHPNNINIPRVGDYVRGQFEDYVEVTDVTTNAGRIYVTSSKDINVDFYSVDPEIVAGNPDIKFCYIINQTGWYSYKVVVRQTEQEYYNCYLPGILNGYPAQNTTTPTPIPFPANEVGKTAHTILLNDNINKIPRDLSEVGPDQKQYRSSVQLFGRVQNTSSSTSTQYFPGRSTDTVSTIGNAVDLNMPATEMVDPSKMYQLDTNPIVARISTQSGSIGTIDANMSPVLSIYETEPVVSLLDIFWETSTAGLISDLNANVLTGYEGATSFSYINFLFKEFQDPDGSDNDIITGVTGVANSPWITDLFYPLDSEGAVLTNTTGTMTVTNMNDPSDDLDTVFSLEQVDQADLNNPGAYRIKMLQAQTFRNNYQVFGSYEFSIQIKNLTSGVSSIITLPPEQTVLTNVQPVFPTEVNGFLPQVNVETTVQNANIGVANYAKNGAIRNKDDDLAYKLLSQSPLPFPGFPNKGFSLNESTGQVRTLYSNMPDGIYTLSIRARDAMVSSNRTTGKTLSNDTQLKVVVGDQTTNVPTNCYPTSVGANTQGWPDKVAANSSTTSPRFGGIFLFSDSGTGSPGGCLNDPQCVWKQQLPDWAWYAVNDGNIQSVTNVGPSLEKGVLQTNLMIEIERTLPKQRDYYFYIRANVQTKPKSSPLQSNNWSDKEPVYDYQNNNITEALLEAENDNLMSMNVPNQVGEKNLFSLPMVFDAQLDYCISWQVIGLPYSPEPGGFTSKIWISTGDFTAGDCVIVDGVNVANGTGRDADYYEYNLYDQSQGGTSTSANLACTYSTATPRTLYSRTPYGVYVDQFFTDPNLLPQNGFISPNSNNFYSYEYQAGPLNTSANRLEERISASIENTSFLNGVIKENDNFVKTAKTFRCEIAPTNPGFGDTIQTLPYYRWGANAGG